MRINLRRIQVLVSEKLLQRPDIDAVLQHERSGCMPQFMRRVLRAVKTRRKQMFLYEAVDRRGADPRTAA